MPASGLNEDTEAAIRAVVRDELASHTSSVLDSVPFSRREILVGFGILGAGGTLGAYGAIGRAAGTSHGTGSIGTSDNPVSAIYVDELFQETDNLDVGTLEIDTISGGVTGLGGDVDSLVGNGLFVSNGDLQVMPDVLQDGDGTGRDVWVIANGASDPAGASSGDLIFEEEA